MTVSSNGSSSSYNNRCCCPAMSNPRMFTFSSRHRKSRLRPLMPSSNTRLILPHRANCLTYCILVMSMVLRSSQSLQVPWRLPQALWNQTKHEVAEGISCNSDNDLHRDLCELWDLPDYALLDICDQLGVNAEDEMFPEMLQVTERRGNLTLYRDPDHDDFVYVAAECIYKEYLEHKEESDPKKLAENDEALAEHLLHVLEEHTHLIHNLEVALQEHDPELWEAVEREMEEHEMLADRPDLLLRLIWQLLDEDPELLVIGDEERLRHMERHIRAEMEEL